jgi:hypothetical protein
MASQRSCRLPVLGAALALAACAGGGGTGQPEAAGPAAPATAPAAPLSAGWPAPAACRTVAAELGATKDRLPGSPAGAPLGVLLLGGQQGLTVELDMALPVATSGAPPSAPCLLIVGLPADPPTATRRTLGTDSVLSDYQSGTHERANPAYAQARRELGLADASARETGSGRLRSTGDLALDLIGLAASGLIRGVGDYVDGHKIEAAEAKLAATPPTIEDPLYRSYRLTILNVAAEKEVRARVALVDRRSGEVWEAPRTVTAKEEIEVAQGLHPRDRGIAEGKAAYRSPAELRQWERAPIDIALSDLLAWTVADTAARPPGRQGLDRLLASWQADAGRQRVADAAPQADPPATGSLLPEPAAGPAAGPATRVPARPSPSLVSVEGLGGTGGGFYVTSEEILTARSLVGDTSLVKVRTASGLVTYGIVERDDAALDLLLVHVQKDGPPLPIAQDEAVALEVDPGAEVGAPILRDGRVAAVMTGAADGRPVGAPQLRAFLAAGRP